MTTIQVEQPKRRGCDINMKLGGHIYLWTDHWSNAQLGLFDGARELGLSCLEIAVGDDIEFDAAAVRNRAETLDMDVILSPGAKWPMEMDISHGDPSCRSAGVAWHREWISKAAEAGAVAYMGAIYGHPGRVEGSKKTLDDMRRTADNLRLLVEHAENQGVLLAIEPMNRYRTHVVNTPNDAMQLLGLVDSPHLQVLLDTYHLVTEVRDFGDAIRSCHGHLCAIHACENDRGAPGNGIVPWEIVFDAIKETGFDNYIIFESYNSSLDGFAVSRGLFHDVCPDGDQFVRDSLSFIRECLNHILEVKQS